MESLIHQLRDSIMRRINHFIIEFFNTIGPRQNLDKLQ